MPVTVNLPTGPLDVPDREACLVLRPLIDAYLGGPDAGRRQYTAVLSQFADECASHKKKQGDERSEVANLLDLAGERGLNARNKMVSQEPPQVLHHRDFGHARRHTIEYAFNVVIPKKINKADQSDRFDKLLKDSLFAIGWTAPESDAIGIVSNNLQVTNPSNGWRPKRPIRYSNLPALHRLAGHYLVLRRTFSDRPNHLIVSFMELIGPSREGDPGYFRTHGRRSVRGKDNTFVDGLYYVFGGNSFDDMHIAFEGAVGEPDAAELHNPQPRYSILKQAENPANPNADKKDLCGIRQGIGRVKFRPRGYRIFCPRIDSAGVIANWQSLIGEYELRHHTDPLHGNAAAIAWRESQRRKNPDLVRRIERMWPHLKPVLRFRTSPVELAHAEDQKRLSSVVPGLEEIISWLSVKSFTDFIDEVADPKFRSR